MPFAQAGRWFDATFLDLARQMRCSFLPPIMVFLVAVIGPMSPLGHL